MTTITILTKNWKINNHQRTVNKLHDAGWKNGYFDSSDAAMLGHGCGVFLYPQFYDKRLEKYQFLPRPYLGSFVRNNGKNDARKMDVRFGRWSWKICLGVY